MTPPPLSLLPQFTGSMRRRGVGLGAAFALAVSLAVGGTP